MRAKGQKHGIFLPHPILQNALPPALVFLNDVAVRCINAKHAGGQCAKRRSFRLWISNSSLSPLASRLSTLDFVKGKINILCMRYIYGVLWSVFSRVEGEGEVDWRGYPPVVVFDGGST